MDTKGIFVSLLVGTLVVAGLYLWCVNPEVVVARIRFHRGTKRWDRILLCFLLPAVYGVSLIAALDHGRHWSPVPWWVCAIGYVLFLVGVGIVTRAEAVNKFFEKTVRIQTDRGHKVIEPALTPSCVIPATSALCCSSWAAPCAWVPCGR